MSTDDLAPGLRERKRLRTRAAIVEAGRRLFEERGYDETTIADIAAEADIGTRTFFAYFESKDQLLFPQADWRVAAALDAIRDREPGDTPAQALLRGLDTATTDDDIVSPLAQLRLRLSLEVPAVQGRALRTQLEAQRSIADALAASYPELGESRVMAIVGAFIGATTGAIQALPTLADGTPDLEGRAAQLRESVAYALGVG